MATQGPPIPTAPSGVHGRVGLYFGVTIAYRGSSGNMNGKPGQNPMQAFHHSVAQTSSMTACTLLSPLYWAMYSMLCPFTMLGASCRVYLTYRSMSARVHRSENAIGSSTRRLGMFRFSPAGTVS